jgi:predicted DNA-binding protein with PD1-like motif
MDVLPIRLSPGDDLRRALEAALANAGHEAGFVLAGIGSLSRARLRFAEVDDAPIRTGAFEILTLCGSVSPEASHLHATLADADGAVVGGHVAYGCVVRTTAEVLLACLGAWRFSREHDADTGHDELVVRHRKAEGGS